MVAEIITIGTEILLGSILNTNSNYLSRELVGLGVETYYHTTVDDDKDRLKKVLEIAFKRANIIITTGGLGPTDDDLSKEALADTLGLKMLKDLEAEENLVHRFKSMNSKMTNNNLRQIYKPEGAKFIPNDKGTAPGIYLEDNNVKIIMLPGPPREMSHMFKNYVIDLIKDKYHIITKSINVYGIGESALEEELKSLDLYEDGFVIATFAQLSSCEIKIIGKGLNLELVNNKVKDKADIIKTHLGDYIYGYDNISLEETLVSNLKKRNYKLSICESCTGGLLTSKITSISGVSEVFELGLITYSNDAKIEELNVSNKTLEIYGSVSKETAYEMAQGLYNKTQSNAIISITGIAGPSGGSKAKPVGIVHFCIMINGKAKLIEKIFSGDRLAIQERAAKFALSELNKIIK